MLVGAVVLAALTALSVPLLRQVHTEILQAQTERQGLKEYARQIDTLFALVEQRSATVAGEANQATVDALFVALQDHWAQLPTKESSTVVARLQSDWRQARGNGKDDANQARRFTALNGTLTALLELIRDSSRAYRLPQDDELGATFDMLTTRLPQVAETLARQRDALTLNSREMASSALGSQALSDSAAALQAGLAKLAAGHPEIADLQQNLDDLLERIAGQQGTSYRTLYGTKARARANGKMASYALGAQVVLSESAPSLQAGITQLTRVHPQATPLQQELAELLEHIAEQQSSAEQTLDSPTALAELRALANSNVHRTRSLLFATIQHADDALRARISALQRSQLLIAVLLVGTIGAIAYLFAGIYLSTLGSLRHLADGTEAFCSGRLDTRIRLDTRDELVFVARNFNTVASKFEQLLEVIREQNASRQRELEEQVAARTSELAEKNEALRIAGERVQEELMLARNMQRAILPQRFPDETHWAVHAAMYPARELGGDFYDCFPLPDGRYGLLIADVSGKGVGAAFFMAVSHTVLLDLAVTGNAPSWVLAHANDLLCDRNPMELFVTACYAIYDPVTGLFTYANAGHASPLRRQAAGTVEALPSPMDVALGVMPDMAYSDQQVTLQRGDALLLYTDGVTEAFAASGEAYGDARLHAWLARIAPETAAATIIASLVRDVETFVAGAEASDDLTSLILCRK